MSELLQDDTIRDFLFDYSRLKETEFSYKEAQDIMYQRLPVYMHRFRTLANRMTQEGLAMALEVDHSYISKIENSHEKPSTDFLVKLNEFIKTWGQDA